MISIQVIAFILLIARIISVSFIITVLFIQARQLGRKIDFSLVPNLSKYQKANIYRIRRVLFTLAIIILLGNIVPILIDWITLITDNSLGRTPEVKPISVAYACSNAFTAMFSAIMIWALYKLAGIGDPKNDNK